MPKYPYLSLAAAQALGYGKVDTLNHAIHRKKLKAVKFGRDWTTTEKWLQEAGYKKPENLIYPD